MTLKSALYTIKKNPTSLLKKDNDIYFVSEKHFSDVPYSIGICNGLTPWPAGFAHGFKSYGNCLKVGYKDLTATNWEILDGTDIVITDNPVSEELKTYVKEFDDTNKYCPDKSKYGQRLLEEGNKILKSMNSPCVLTLEPTHYYTTDFKLEAPGDIDISWRFKSTKALIELKDRLVQEERLLQEKKLFEENRPSDEIVIRKVEMPEFLNRLENSKKLWCLDATNFWKRDKSGYAIGKDWENASLTPVVLTRSQYGGARTDRLATRNAFTNSIGLPNCSGKSFYSLDDKTGWGGTFFADVVNSYGREGDYIIVDDNEMLVLVHDKKLPSVHDEFNYIQSLTSPQERSNTSYNNIQKILNKRLSNFESFSKKMREYIMIYGEILPNYDKIPVLGTHK